MGMPLHDESEIRRYYGIDGYKNVKIMEKKLNAQSMGLLFNGRNFTVIGSSNLNIEDLVKIISHPYRTWTPEFIGKDVDGNQLMETVSHLPLEPSEPMHELELLISMPQLYIPNDNVTDTAVNEKVIEGMLKLDAAFRRFRS